MKYIHILDEFSLAGGGVRSVVSDVSQEMASKGLDVYIFTLIIPQGASAKEIDEWAAEKNIKFEILSKGNNLLTASLRLRRILKCICKEDECCLYMHLKKGVLLGILSSLCLKKVRRVEVYHSGYLHYKLQSFLSRPFIHHYLSVSKDAKNQLVKQFGVKEEKVTVAYNGVDLDKLQAGAIDRRENHDKVRFLTVGRLAYPKNIDLSVEAFSRLVKKNHDIDAEYLIAGEGPDLEKLKQVSEGKVCFLGLIDRMAVCSNLASADVVVFPSLWEGNSIALLETIAIGNTLLVTDIPSFREVLGNEPLADDELFRPEPFGAVMHKNRVDSCMAAMDYLYHNRKALPDMKEYVSKLACLFTIEKQTNNYIKIANIKQ